MKVNVTTGARRRVWVDRLMKGISFYISLVLLQIKSCIHGKNGSSTWLPVHLSAESYHCYSHVTKHAAFKFLLAYFFFHCTKGNYVFGKIKYDFYVLVPLSAGFFSESFPRLRS